MAWKLPGNVFKSANCKVLRCIFSTVYHDYYPWAVSFGWLSLEAMFNAWSSKWESFLPISHKSKSCTATIFFFMILNEVQDLVLSWKCFYVIVQKIGNHLSYVTSSVCEAIFSTIKGHGICSADYTAQTLWRNIKNRTCERVSYLHWNVLNTICVIHQVY